MFGFEMNSFNVDDGFAEATCRALSKGLLREDDYERLRNCNNIVDFKMMLDETDYQQYLHNPDGGTLDVNWLKKRLYTKLKDEINYLKAQASQPLSTFLDKMMHCYQIENVVSIIMG
jgi:V-type H+-transporting ATPase subunit d